MPAWTRALMTWWSQRRRFGEEWAFYLDMATAEFESLGLDRRQARQLARQRLHSYFSYRRARFALFEDQ